jgi:hypothetical protein
MRFLILLTALLFSFTANADNIRQKDTGATVWENSSGVQYPVGNGGLTVTISSISTPMTSYVVTHRPGVVTKIYAVLHGTLVGTDGSTFTFFKGADGQYAPISSGGSLILTGNTAGAVGTMDPTGTGVNVTQGQAIAIVNNGNSNDETPATFTIVIE